MLFSALGQLEKWSFLNMKLKKKKLMLISKLILFEFTCYLLPSYIFYQLFLNISSLLHSCKRLYHVLPQAILGPIAVGLPSIFEFLMFKKLCCQGTCNEEIFHETYTFQRKNKKCKRNIPIQNIQDKAIMAFN